MKSPIPDYLEEVLETVRLDQSGELASYIPQLATADPDRLAAVFATLDGQVYGVGDVDHQFSIQSISKPFVYALALADRGFDDVLFKVDVEPSGEAFNELSLEGNTGRPRNPMINAGAITIHSLVGRPDSTPEERFERVMSGLSALLDVGLRWMRRCTPRKWTTRTVILPSPICCVATILCKRIRLP